LLRDERDVLVLDIESKSIEDTYVDVCNPDKGLTLQTPFFAELSRGNEREKWQRMSEWCLFRRGNFA
jgi:hypothetical protein